MAKRFRDGRETLWDFAATYLARGLRRVLPYTEHNRIYGLPELVRPGEASERP